MVLQRKFYFLSSENREIAVILSCFKEGIMKEILLLLAMFWNLENFFDPFDDPRLAGDDPFTPRGEKFWTWKKFVKKQDDIAKVIMLVREEYGVFPAIIGVCEVENRFVLNGLVTKTPLAREGYRVIHKDSPDSRGIDVALLYKPDVFKVLQVRFFPLAGINSGDSVKASRLILYVKGVVNGLDTLHVFVNHWPSKLGGEKGSLPRRMVASEVVKVKTDSILTENKRANVVLMGDFNDTPFSEPLQNLDQFVNMAKRLSGRGKGGKGFVGTHKYKERWELIDQFLVSESMAPVGDGGGVQGDVFLERWVYCKEESMEIFMPEYLLQRDDVYLGAKMRKTLSGPRYMGGVSDHLPVILRVYGKGEE